LYPDQPFEDIAKRWVADGAAAVVVTRGVNGSIGYTESGVEEAPGVKIDLADTVGAGDTVGAIIIEAIVQDGILSLQGEGLKKVLTRSAKAAAITCSRAGAQPPYAHELTKP
jgi:fructokinase